MVRDAKILKKREDELPNRGNDISITSRYLRAKSERAISAANEKSLA